MKRLLALPLLVLAGACSDSPSEPGPPPAAEVQVGTTLSLNVQSGDGKACTDADMRTGRVVAISDRAIIVEDPQNPSGGFTEAEYRELAEQFDDLVYPTVVANFGAPGDVDRNGRVVVFYTRAVNELTPEGQDYYIGGYFFSRDLFPTTATAGFSPCATSNYAEMFYMLVPDPSGAVNGNPRSKDFVQTVTISTLAHEFQHLVNSSRRLYVTKVGGNEWSEQVWLNEGLSHIAEELLGYRAGGMSPGQNLDAADVNSSQIASDAFYGYHVPNLSRLNSYLQNPDTASLLGDDNLSTRGATWQFLRYAADRKGGSEAQLWKGLVDAPANGIENLKQALGGSATDWMRDWTVAVYTDDAVKGVEQKFTQPSWNFRSIMPRFKSNNGKFPLQTHTLSNSGSTDIELRDGGAVYLRFGVAPLGRAEVRVDPAAGTCSQTVELNVGEVFTAAADQAASLCVSGGAQGGEFTYIPFFASDTIVEGRRIPMEITASGVRGVTGPPNPSLRPSASLSLEPTAGGALVPRPDRAWEMQLRTREIRELSRLVPGANAALRPELSLSRSVSRAAVFQAGAVDPRLRVSVVRTQ